MWPHRAMLLGGYLDVSIREKCCVVLWDKFDCLGVGKGGDIEAHVLHFNASANAVERFGCKMRAVLH